MQNLFSNNCAFVSCKCLDIKAHTKNKYQKLFEKGQSVLENELDVVTVIDDLQNWRIMYRTYLIDKYREMCINHNKVNILNIDTTSSDEDVSISRFEDSDSEKTANKSFNELEFVLNQ